MNKSSTRPNKKAAKKRSHTDVESSCSSQGDCRVAHTHGALQHYRLSVVGQDLTETLDELITNDMLKKEYSDLVLEHFERSMRAALAKQGKHNKIYIKGKIKHYRHHDDIWTFVLESIDLKFNGKQVSSNGKTQMITVAKH